MRNVVSSHTWAKEEIKTSCLLRIKRQKEEGVNIL
jgi:hypothetical protein